MPDRARLEPAVFNLPVGRIRSGYYSDQYFNLAKQLLEHEQRHPRVLMQVFQRHDSVLGGIDEAIAVLKLGAGRPGPGGSWELGWERLEVNALHEGDSIAAHETVLTIEGDYSLFAHLETVYLGCLARRSLVMRNVRTVVEAAAGKPILFFPARHDHWLVQTGDGWAAHVAGAIGVSTDAQASWWGGRGVGTVPHALIAAYGGDTVAAARAFAARYAAEMNVTVLVDFDNRSAATAIEVADALGEGLWGVRLDTSDSLVDEGLADLGEAAPTGVSVELARRVRAALDDAGHQRVRIVVSGGFTADKIIGFERAEAPVDAYGVGSSLLRGENDFTADVVTVEGRAVAKVGRRHALTRAWSRSTERQRNAQSSADQRRQASAAASRAGPSASPARLESQSRSASPATRVPMNASPAPSVVTTSTSGAGASAAQAPRITAPSAPSVTTASSAPIAASATAASRGSSTDAIAVASSRLARTRNEPSINSREKRAAGSDLPAPAIGADVGVKTDVDAALERQLAGAQGDLAFTRGRQGRRAVDERVGCGDSGLDSRGDRLDRDRDRVAVDLKARFAAGVEAGEGDRGLFVLDRAEEAQIDPLALEPRRQPLAPLVVAGGTGKPGLGPGPGRRHRDVGERAAEVRRERIGLGE